MSEPPLTRRSPRARWGEEARDATVVSSKRTAPSTRGGETPGQKARFESGPLASDTACHSSVAGPTAPFLSSAGKRHLPQLSSSWSPTGLSSPPGPEWGRCGGAARLQQWPFPSRHPEISVGRNRGSEMQGGGRGGPLGSAAERCAAGGEGQRLSSSLRGLGTQGCKAGAGGCDNSAEVGTYHRTQWRGGAGKGLGHRGEPPPPFAQAYN